MLMDIRFMLSHSGSGIGWLFLLLLLLPARLAAQQKIVFNEEFADNSLGWWVGADGNVSASISNGTYRLQWKTEGFWYMPRTVFIDTAKDYVIEAAIRQVAGIDNHGYGIVWGRNGDGRHHEFIVNSNGQRLVTTLNGEWINQQPWVADSAIRPMGETNVLTIERKGSQLHYRINGTEVATTPPLDFYGLDIGIVLNRQMTVEVDRLTVRQDQPPINFVPNMPGRVEKVNLGPNINSTYSDYLPVIAPDGSTLYLSVRYSPDNAGGKEDADEIWIATALTDSTWSQRRRADAPLNNAGPNWVISVTPDNNTLLIANQYNADGTQKGSGLSLAHRIASGWSVPEDIVIRNLTNNSGWYQFCLSADRKSLLMSVVGGQTYGLHDLYVSFLESDGTWSEQKNLGTSINTIGEEACPFLAADGVTLFFASNGRPGIGEGDIYVTRRLDDSWTRWSEPQNLGPAINTTGNDGFFTVPASGRYAYMVSSHNTTGGDDILRLRLPKAIRPNPVVLISGTVIDSKTRKPVGAEITYRDLASDQEVGVASSNPADGSYKIVLPAGRSYSFMADEQGYYAVSDNLDVKELKEYREIRRDLYLTPIEVGAIIRLNNLFFDFAKADLRTESYPELNRAMNFLNDNPGIAIEVAGHTDNVGSDDANRKLSDDRARAVKEYLIAQGVQPERIVSKGYGESKPVATNNTDEGRQLNRRVDFTIVRK
jgi:outer membrane protein OmpA-like peptidoglycan-associated protein